MKKTINAFLSELDPEMQLIPHPFLIILQYRKTLQTFWLTCQKRQQVTPFFEKNYEIILGNYLNTTIFLDFPQQQKTIPSGPIQKKTTIWSQY